MVEDARQHPMYGQMAITRDINIGSYIGVPISLSDGQTVGTLCGLDPEPRTFTKEQLSFLEIMAHITGTMLEHGFARVPEGETDLTPSDLPTESPLPEPSIPSAPNEIVLLDSTSEERQPLKATFEQAGFQVKELPDRLTYPLLDEIAKMRPGLLIWVANEPVQESLALLRYLRAQPENQGVPLLFLTRQDSASISYAAYQAGATRCFPYALGPEALLEKVLMISTR